MKRGESGEAMGEGTAASSGSGAAEPPRGRHARRFPSRAWLILLLLPSASGPAAAQTVFGPELFERQAGEPVTVSRTFKIAKPTADYLLRIHNGGLEGETFERVSGSSVSLNGAPVVGPEALNQNVAFIEAPVSLRASNRLEVQLRGKLGGAIRIEIVRVGGEPPTISAVLSPPPNANGWNNTEVTVTFVCGPTPDVACPQPVVVSAEGAGQLVSGTAVGPEGDTATVTVVVNIDRTAPTVLILDPSEGAILEATEAAVQGLSVDALSGVERTEVNGIAAIPSGSNWAASVPIEAPAGSIQARAHDLAGNVGTDAVSVTLALPPPEVSILDPPSGLVTRLGSVAVSGRVSPGAAVAVNGVAAAVGDGAFQLPDFPLAEGTNTLTAVAVTATAGTAADTVIVRRDTVPPLVVIETPRDGDRLVGESVPVAGTVSDLVPGATVNADDVSVTVNGMPAPVNNRTFFLEALPLAEGVNTITVQAVDRAGNTRSASIQVSLEPDLTGIRLIIVRGNAQSGPIRSRLALPLVVRLENAAGDPLPGRPVEFTVSRGDGLLDDPALLRRSLARLTDGQGEAPVGFTLGSRTGVGFHRIRATTPGSLTFAEFCATAAPTQPVNVAINRMPPGRSTAGRTMTEPLSVIVTDAGGNPVPEVPVSFRVELGGGAFDGQATRIVSTNPDGLAEAPWTLGPSSGTGNNVATATFDGNPGLPATFTVSGVELGPAEQTSVSGLVQDSTGRPIPGVRVVIRGTSLEARTGADGRFFIPGVQPGGRHVGILGSTVVDPPPGVFWPDIDFAMEVFSGVDNPFDQVVVLPFIDQENARLVGGDEDAVLSMKDVPGFAVKVFAHSVIRPDGTRGPVLMSSSQVKFDKMPMPPPQGSTPLIVGTLQPPGVRFDPPAQVTYPNAAGLAPGDVADIFTFHHDIGQFVNAGPATVSPDGTVATSDPGFGIVEAGWHCLIRIPGEAATCANECSARIEWQEVRPDGRLGPVQSGGSVVARRARVRALFSPAGGSFDGAAWTGATAEVTSGDEVAGGSTAEMTVTAVADAGSATLTSPSYRIADPDGSERTCQAEVEVRVPTREVVVIAWVDPAAIDLDSLAGQANVVLRSALENPISCVAQVGAWVTGFPLDVFNDADRRYANAFLLEHSPNGRPADTINPENERIVGDYRLFSRFQVVAGEGGAPAEILSDPPLVGDTPDPCTGLIFATSQPHPVNGANGPSTSGSGVFQINEGRLGRTGQAVDLTLNDCGLVLPLGQCSNWPLFIGRTTPWIWSVIRFDPQGRVLPVLSQIFPSYAIYVDGQVVERRTQSDPEVFIARDAEDSEILPGDIP